MELVIYTAILLVYSYLYLVARYRAKVAIKEAQFWYRVYQINVLENPKCVRGYIQARDEKERESKRDK